MTTKSTIITMLTIGLGLLSTIATKAAEKPALSQSPAGIFHAATDATYVYQSDVYRVAFDKTGQMVSLRVKGQEFLRPATPGATEANDGSGAAFYSNGKRVIQDSIQINADSGLIADGVHGSFLNLHPDRIDLDLGNDNTAGLDEYVFFPAKGVKVTAVEAPVMRGTRTETWQIVGTKAWRWTAPDGTSIELQYEAKPTDNYHGSPAMPVRVPFKTRLCGEIRFPKSAWGSNLAVVQVETSHEDHVYARGEAVDVTGTVELRSEDKQPRSLELLVQMEDMNLSTVAWEERQTVKITPGVNAPFKQTVKWDRPGPWRLRVFALDGDHAIGYKAGVVVYDLPGYKPALARPADFWKFWEDAIASQRRLPLAPMRTKNEAASTEKFTVYDVFITGYMGRRLAAKWIEPAAPGRYPVTMGAAHPGAAVIPPTEDGICSLQYSMDGSATYRTGLGSRYTSNLFYNYIDTLRWLDFMASCEKADMNRSVYFGGSRSGPPGIAAAALDPRLKMYIANVPTNNRWDWQVTLPGATGWGPWAADRPEGQSLQAFANELSYFNPDNFAERVHQPVLIGFGLLDGLSQVTGNLATFARLESKQKKMCFRPWYGHSDANEDWYATSAAWRKELYAHPAQ